VYGFPNAWNQSLPVEQCFVVCLIMPTWQLFETATEAFSAFAVELDNLNAAAVWIIPCYLPHLLQANTWTAQNTQSAIRAAAAGTIPASYATAAGSRNAQLAGGGCVNCLKWGL
jgi:hypothetical protein